MWSNYEAQSAFYGYHGGGTVGIGNRPARLLPSSLLDQAPRLHGGLTADEYPAILRYRETVRTPEQEASLQAGRHNRFELHVHDETGLGVEIVEEPIEEKMEKTVAHLRVRDTLRRRVTALGY